MTRLGVVIAMEKEFDALFPNDKYRDGELSTTNGFEIVPLVSGIGKVNAAIAAYRLCNEWNCDKILSVGCAAGAQQDLCIGDIVIGNKYIYWDVYHGAPNAVGQVQDYPESYKADANLMRWAKRRLKDAGVMHVGCVSTGDTFLENKIVIDHIFIANIDASPLVFDMESAAVAQVCYRYKTPFVSVRVISDIPALEDKSKQYVDFWKEHSHCLTLVGEKLFEK